MRAPNSAEAISPPIPNPDTTHQAVAPNIIDTTYPTGRRRAVGVASVMLTTTALASGLVPSPGQQAEHGEEAHGPDRVAATTYRVDNIRPAGYASDVYTGRVTIRATRSTRSTNTTQQPSLVENDGVLIAAQRGISTDRVAQGKKTEVNIAGTTVDLADYTKPTRVAEPWKTSKDCAWRWAEQDILIAGQKAGLSPDKIKDTVSDAKNVQRVMRGYFTDNPSLREAPHFLNTGVGYVAKHARAEADELVGTMRAAQQTPKPKTDPDTKAQTQPDYKPRHAAPSPVSKEQGYSFKEIAVTTVKIGGLAVGGVLLAAGAFLGVGRWRRRRRERYEATTPTKPTGGNHRSPDPDGPGSPPPSDGFDDLRQITEEDEKTGRDPMGLPSTGSHSTIGGGLGKSPYSPPAEAQSGAPASANNRARFSYGGPVEPGTRRPTHLRSVRLTDNYPLASDVRPRRQFPEVPSFGIAEVPPVLRLVDAPTDPNNGQVLPFRSTRRPLEGRGWIDPITGERRSKYRGVHRPIFDSDEDDLTDATERIAAAV